MWCVVKGVTDFMWVRTKKENLGIQKLVVLSVGREEV